MDSRKNLPSRRLDPRVAAPFFSNRRCRTAAIQPDGTIFLPSPNIHFCRSVFAGLVVGGVVGSAMAAPLLESDLGPRAGVSDDGTIDLVWRGEGPEYELQQSTDADFSDAHLRYRGPDTESVLTGLAEGTYHFRVRETGATEWSEPLRIKVEYMHRGQLHLLLGTGAFVAVLTIGAILHGFAKSR